MSVLNQHLQHVENISPFVIINVYFFVFMNTSASWRFADAGLRVSLACPLP